MHSSAVSRKKRLVTSSHQRCSMKKGILRNFVKFTEKHLWQSLFFNKVAGKATLAQVFPENFTKFLRTPFLQNTSGWLLPTSSENYRIYVLPGWFDTRLTKMFVFSWTNTLMWTTLRDWLIIYGRFKIEWFIFHWNYGKQILRCCNSSKNLAG